MGALATAVQSGRALYAGISNYPAERTREAAELLRRLGAPLLVNQPSYSILDRWIEPDLLAAVDEVGCGCVVFSPLAQGLLTDRYLAGIPEGSRAARGTFLTREMVTEAVVKRVNELNEIAGRRGQTLAQMSLAWILRDRRITSAVIGASTVEQLDQNLGALDNVSFAEDELDVIDRAAAA